MSLRTISLSAAILALSGCGVVYTAPSVHDGVPFGTAYSTEYDVKIIPLSYESAAAANLETYVPARLPAAFQPGASAGVAAALQIPQLSASPTATVPAPTP